MYALLKIQPLTNPEVLHIDMEKGSLENFMRVTKIAEKRGNRCNQRAEGCRRSDYFGED